ncbi:MAG: CoA-binding protein [Acidobacteria bacterium]|nr:CoA-binding protein [Acidobacteriota bacterium]
MPRKRVAVVGASSQRHKYGNKALRAYLQEGFEVYPVNPHQERVEELLSYPSILDIPVPLDMATFYVPPEVGIRLLDEVRQKGVPEVWLNPGSESPELLQRAEELGLKVIQACSILAIGVSPSDL